MSLRDYLRRVGSFPGPSPSPRRSRKNGLRPQLESLEDRMLPAILFTPAFGIENAVNHAPASLLPSNTPVFLIFWGGAEFSDGQGNPNAAAVKFEQAALRVFPGPYLSALANYDNVLGNATIAGARVDTSEPKSGFSVNNLLDVVDNATDNLGVPEVDDINGVTPLYVVITPSGIVSDQVDPQGTPVLGYHGTWDLGGVFDPDSSPVAWVGTNGTFDQGTAKEQQTATDQATVILSHEVVVSTTDTDPSNHPALTVAPGATWPGPNGSELADNEAQNFTYRLNGTLVQSYWSDNTNFPGFNKYIVPDGNVQNFVVTAGVLTVNGDQLANKGDNITIGLSPQGGVQVHLNTEMATFEPGAINSIEVNTLTGTNNVTVQATSVPVTVNTSAGTNNVTVQGTFLPVTVNTSGGDNVVVVQATAQFGQVKIINGGGIDFVTIGDHGSVQGIRGPVTVDSLPQLTTLTVDNGADAVGQKKVTITTAQITGLAPPTASINYMGSQLASLTINGGHGVNTYNVQSTPGLGGERGVPVTLNLAPPTSIVGPGGTDFVNVGSPAGTLASIQGPLTVNGLSGTTVSLTLNDQGANAGQSYLFSGAKLTRSGAAPITYSGVAAMQINAGTSSDTFTFASAVAASTHLTLNGNGVTNSLTGPNLANTWVLQGPNQGVFDGNVIFFGMQNLMGGSQSDAFQFLGPTAGVAGTIDGGGGIGNSLDYQFNGGAAVTVNLASVSSGQAPGINLGFRNIDSLVGSTAADTLVGPNWPTNDWSITGNSTGNLVAVNQLVVVGSAGKFSFQKIEKLVGGSGVDTFQFSPGGSITALDGGAAGGGDWLDYSLFPANSPVTVNLTSGQATGVSAGVTNIQNVLGGAGNDTLTGSVLGSILLGGAGNDVLKGAGGGNLLIGGQGSDTVTAGSGGDILIGGWTDYDVSSDAHRSALAAIMMEWRSVKPGTPLQAYLTRVGDLSNGGGLNGNFKLNNFTVHDDNAVDSLTGGAGLDWFFAHNVNQLGGDVLMGQSAGEQVYLLP